MFVIPRSASFVAKSSVRFCDCRVNMNTPSSTRNIANSFGGTAGSTVLSGMKTMLGMLSTGVSTATSSCSSASRQAVIFSCSPNVNI